MKLKAGEQYISKCGEVFGPLKESAEFALPFVAKKFGQTFTFHTNGRYSNDPTHPHILDLVVVAK